MFGNRTLLYFFRTQLWRDFELECGFYSLHLRGSQNEFCGLESGSRGRNGTTVHILIFPWRLFWTKMVGGGAGIRGMAAGASSSAHICPIFGVFGVLLSGKKWSCPRASIGSETSANFAVIFHTKAPKLSVAYQRLLCMKNAKNLTMKNWENQINHRNR